MHHELEHCHGVEVSCSVNVPEVVFSMMLIHCLPLFNSTEACFQLLSWYLHFFMENKMFILLSIEYTTQASSFSNMELVIRWNIPSPPFLIG